MFVAKINDDCLLEADFLRRIGLKNIFDREFNESKLNEKEIYNCSRIEDSPTVPSILKELFESDSVNLEITQRKIFADFLNNFRDVFSENIGVGNCDIVEHVINVKDYFPIKQVPRRIPI